MDRVNWKPGVTVSETGKQVGYTVSNLADARRLTLKHREGRTDLVYTTVFQKAPELRVCLLRSFQKG